jgi:hypothetical protein
LLQIESREFNLRMFDRPGLGGGKRGEKVARTSGDGEGSKQTGDINHIKNTKTKGQERRN